MNQNLRLVLLWQEQIWGVHHSAGICGCCFVVCSHAYVEPNTSILCDIIWMLGPLILIKCILQLASLRDRGAAQTCTGLPGGLCSVKNPALDSFEQIDFCSSQIWRSICGGLTSVPLPRVIQVLSPRFPLYGLHGQKLLCYLKIKNESLWYKLKAERCPYTTNL